jgi:hypothetical protein
MTAEALYLRVSDMVDDEVDPELEEALVEMDWTGEVDKSEVENAVRILRETLRGTASCRRP